MHSFALVYFLKEFWFRLFDGLCDVGFLLVVHSWYLADWFVNVQGMELYKHGTRS